VDSCSRSITGPIKNSVGVLEYKISSPRILEDNFEILGLGLDSCVLDYITDQKRDDRRTQRNAAGDSLYSGFDSESCKFSKRLKACVVDKGGYF